jgi:hypothetical protein
MVCSSAGLNLVSMTHPGGARAGALLFGAHL